MKSEKPKQNKQEIETKSEPSSKNENRSESKQVLVQLNQDLSFIPKNKEKPYKDKEELKEHELVLTDEKTAFDLTKHGLAEIITKNVLKNK